ncbi:MAG: diadenylate cyclase CdaA [Solobacterium sp.]|nr:diadenylate cyclase CdaA [Solobacterium sp.]
MASYNLTLRLDSLRTFVIIFLDIFIMWLVFNTVLRLIRTNSRTIQIFKGILLIIFVDGIAKLLGLKTLEFFADIFLNWGFLAIIILFQPELRQLLERLGKTNVFSRISTLTGNEKENLVDQIVKAAMLLSQDQTGALISIEQSHSLEDFISTGTKLNSDVTAELLTSIFVTSTPLHDGAVIIQGDKIACASAYFPPTNLELPSRYGARHRAAIGISEITDAVTIVVSEETGAISITEGGKIFKVNSKQLREHLMRVICGEETEVRGSGRGTQPQAPREVLIEDDITAPDVTIPKTAGKDEKMTRRGDTGVLSVLAIKKQSEETPQSNKIEVEEVIAPGQETEPETVTEDKKGIFSGLFSRHDNTGKEEDRITQLEEELDSIKLPKKKERPVPSYPEQHDTDWIKPVSIHEEPVVQEPVQEEAVPDMPEPEIPEVSSEERMTSEDVRNAREAVLQKLSEGRKEPVLPVDPYATDEELQETAQEEQDPEKLYDTTKLDISKLMGFDDDFDSTFRMVDHMNTDSIDTSDINKGGDTV